MKNKLASKVVVKADTEGDKKEESGEVDCSKNKCFLDMMKGMCGSDNKESTPASTAPSTPAPAPSPPKVKKVKVKAPEAKPVEPYKPVGNPYKDMTDANLKAIAKNVKKASPVDNKPKPPPK